MYSFLLLSLEVGPRAPLARSLVQTYTALAVELAPSIGAPPVVGFLGVCRGIMLLARQFKMDGET